MSVNLVISKNHTEMHGQQNIKPNSSFSRHLRKHVLWRTVGGYFVVIVTIWRKVWSVR
jgi:hypothetical protein